MVEWCVANISSGYPNFHFCHAELSNTLYPGGSEDAASFVFPYLDGAFDMVFAMSVFTHLVPASAQNYIDEKAYAAGSGSINIL